MLNKWRQSCELWGDDDKEDEELRCSESVGGENKAVGRLWGDDDKEDEGYCCSMFVGRVVGCKNEEGVLKREKEKRGVCYPRQVVDGEKAEERESLSKYYKRNLFYLPPFIHLQKGGDPSSRVGTYVDPNS